MITHLIDFFEQGSLITCPHKEAIIERERRLTFTDWDQSARRVAGAILDKEIPINVPVAVFLPKCADELLVDLGLLYAGCAFSNIDCSQPLARIQNIIANLKPALAIAGNAQADLARNAGFAPDSILIVENLLTASSVADRALLQSRRNAIIDTDPATIINTSGSTGVPKSCVLSHRGLIDFVLWFDQEFQLGIDEVVGSLSPFHFDGWIPGLFMSLYRGATINIIPSELAMFPIRLAQYLADRQITFIFWVPTVMVNMASLDVLKDIALPALRTVCFAGEVFPTKHCNYWRRHLPHANYINLYGPIEISVICTFYRLEREFADDEPIPIGAPCRNTGLLLLNENNEACVGQEPGELCVRGSSLGMGYWGDPVKTAKSFTSNPLNLHYPEIIYRTGDLVYRNTRGELMFLGRRDFQIKHQGNLIDLGEIEHFAVQLPGVRNACVLYHTIQKQIVLIYESDKDIPPITIRSDLGKNLPKVMWPTLFHRLPELPRNPNGKIDRQKLVEEFL